MRANQACWRIYEFAPIVPRLGGALMNKIFRLGAFAAVVLAASTAAAQDEDAPHRIAVERLELTGDPIEVGSCTTRLLGRSAKVTNYPIRDGVGLDWTPKIGIFRSSGGDPIVSMEFLRDEKGAFLIARYRHPFSRDASLRPIRKAARTCFARDYEKWAVLNGAKPIN